MLRREQAQEFTENLLEKEVAATRLIGPDRGLPQELVCGVVRWQGTLDWLVARKAERPPTQAAVQILLRLGLYQMFWLDRIPDHAAVNETVELAKSCGCKGQSGFINAVLRACIRERDTLQQALRELRSTQPSVGFSHPEWLCTRWLERWGDTSVRALLEWNNTPPVTYARANTLRANADDLRERWDREKVQASLIPDPGWLGDTLVFELRSHPPLGTLPSFVAGTFYVQDPSTLLAVRELAPAPGETVLDYCAAPGGKTGFLAQLMNNQGRIVAHDIAPNRLQLIQENCTRLGLTCVQITNDAALAALPPGQFDRVLVDAPCSNSGVMRRRVDVRWRITPAEISRLRDTQLQILQQASAHLKAGGTLVYSTCSLEPEENGEVVRAFLKDHPSFHLQNERTIQPFVEKVDGAYVARMVRGV